MLTLNDCQTDRGLLAVARVDPATQEFVDLVNESCKRLLDYGNWWATVVKGRFYVSDRYIVWPRWVGTVIAINQLPGNDTDTRTSWYEFLPLDRDDYQHISECNMDHHRMRGNVAINDVGTAAVYNNVPADSSNYILAYPRSATDYGRTMTIWGTDSNGWPATETLVFPDVVNTTYAFSLRSYRSITRVIKDVTDDYVDVFQCAAQHPGELLEMGHYEPGETKAEYRVSVIQGHCISASCPRYVDAMIKIQHVPAASANDLVSIGNAAVIKLMMMSIHKEEASEPQGAEAESARAIHELNRELENKLPWRQAAIRQDAFAGVNMSAHSAY